jgi:2-hydroxy-4-carboxymuconate semialdehyde hemiacetal dehydrogenase
MINVCVVGTGAIAAQHMKAFREIGGVSLRWVVSRKAEAAREFARQWECDHFTADIKEALSDPAIGLVLITSPSEYHVEQTILSLLAGKDVVVEIPVALSLTESEQITELAGKLRLRVFVCHTMRSFPGIREVRRRIHAGDLHLTQIVGHFAIPRRRNQGMNGSLRSWTDNLLWHHGCHMVDVALWVLGISEAEQVSAILGEASGQPSMVRDATLRFRTKENQLVTHTLTYNTDEFCWEVRFIGCEQTLRYSNGLLLDEDGAEILPLSSWVDLVAQNREILGSIARGLPSDYDLVSVMGSMRVLHAAEVFAQGMSSANALLHEGSRQ